jgi:thiol-disulfide isomerase/thioredoxin
MSCSKEKQSDFATINGKVHSNIEEIEFQRFEKNPAQMRTEPYIAQVDSTGRFSVKIPIQSINKGYMVFNNNRNDLVLIPGDQLKIDIKNDTILYAGKGAEKNNFLYKLEKNKKCSRHHIMRSLYTKKLALDSIYQMINNYESSRKQELKEFQKVNTLEKEFVKFYDIETKMTVVSLLNHTPHILSRKRKQPLDSLQIPAKFNKYKLISSILNDDYLVCREYLQNLNLMIHDQTRRNLERDTTLTRQKAKLSVIMDSLSGKTREHYMVQEIYDKLTIRDNYDTTLIEAFKSINSNSNCKKVVDKEIAKYKNKQSMIGKPLPKDVLQTVLYDTSGSEVTLNEIITKHNGNVIYLDIWSLGCGPCRRAMSFSKKLKEEFADQPVEFIYTSVDRRYKKFWSKVFKISKTKENHYRFKKGFHSKLHDKFRIRAVPTYMLIDKQGKLVSYDAERPYNKKMKTNPKLKKRLSDLASK